MKSPIFIIACLLLLALSFAAPRQPTPTGSVGTTGVTKTSTVIVNDTNITTMTDSCGNPLQIFVNVSNINQIDVKYLITPRIQSNSSFCKQFNGLHTCCSDETYETLQVIFNQWKASVKAEADEAITYLNDAFSAYQTFFGSGGGSSVNVSRAIEVAIKDIETKVNATRKNLDKCLNGVTQFGSALICASCEPNSMKYVKNGKFQISQRTLMNLSDSCYPLAESLATLSVTAAEYTMAIMDITSGSGGDSIAWDVRTMLNACPSGVKYAQAPDSLSEIVRISTRTELLRKFLAQGRNVLLTKGEDAFSEWLKSYTDSDYQALHGKEEWDNLMLELKEGTILNYDGRKTYDIDSLLGHTFTKFFGVAPDLDNLEGEGSKFNSWFQKVTLRQSKEDIWLPTCLPEGKIPTRMSLQTHDKLALVDRNRKNPFERDVNYQAPKHDNFADDNDQEDIRRLLGDLDSFGEYENVEGGDRPPRRDKPEGPIEVPVNKTTGFPSNGTASGLPNRTEGNATGVDRKFVRDPNEGPGSVGGPKDGPKGGPKDGPKGGQPRGPPPRGKDEIRKQLETSRGIHLKSFKELFSKDVGNKIVSTEPHRTSEGYATLDSIKLPFPALFESSLDHSSKTYPAHSESSSMYDQMSLQSHCEALTGASKCFICSEKTMNSELCANNIFKGYPSKASLFGPIVPGEFIYRKDGQEFVRNFAIENVKLEAAIKRSLNQRGLSFEEKRVFYEELEHALLKSLEAHTQYELQNEEKVLEGLNSEAKTYLSSVGDIFRTLMRAADTENRYVFNYEVGISHDQVQLCIDRNFCWDAQSGELITDRQQLISHRMTSEDAQSVALQSEPLPVDDAPIYYSYCNGSKCYICLMGSCIYDPSQNTKKRPSGTTTFLADKSYTSLLTEDKTTQLEHRSYCDCAHCYNCWSYAGQEKCEKALYQKPLPQHCTTEAKAADNQLALQYTPSCDGFECQYCWTSNGHKTCKTVQHPELVSRLQLSQRAEGASLGVALHCSLPVAEHVTPEALDACADEVAFKAAWNLRTETYRDKTGSYHCTSAWDQKACHKLENPGAHSKEYEKLSAQQHVLYNACKENNPKAIEALKDQYSYQVLCTGNKCQICQSLGKENPQFCHSIVVKGAFADAHETETELKSSTRGIEEMCKYVNTELYKYGENFNYCNCNGCYLCEFKDGDYQCKPDPTGRKPTKQDCPSGKKKLMVLNNQERNMHDFCSHASSLGFEAFDGYDVKLHRVCECDVGCKMCATVGNEQICHHDDSNSPKDACHRSLNENLDTKNLHDMCQTLWLAQATTYSKRVTCTNDVCQVCETINGKTKCRKETQKDAVPPQTLNIQGACAERHYLKVKEEIDDENRINFKYRSFCNCSGCYYCESIDGVQYACEKVSETVETIEPCKKNVQYHVEKKSGSLDDLCGVVAEANLVSLFTQRYYCDCRGCYSCLRYLSSENCKFLQEAPQHLSGNCDKLQLSPVLNFEGNTIRLNTKSHPEKHEQDHSTRITVASAVTQTEGDFATFCRSMPLEVMSKITLEGKYFCNCASCYRCFNFGSGTTCSELWWAGNRLKTADCKSRVNAADIQPVTLLQLCMYQFSPVSKADQIGLLASKNIDIQYPFYGSFARVKASSDVHNVSKVIGSVSCWDRELSEGQKEHVCIAPLEMDAREYAHVRLDNVTIVDNASKLDNVSWFGINPERICNETGCFRCVTGYGTTKCWPLEVGPSQNASFSNETAPAEGNKDITILKINSKEELIQLEEILSQAEKWKYRTYCKDKDCFACVKPTTIHSKEVCYNLASTYVEGDLTTYSLSSSPDTRTTRKNKKSASSRLLSEKGPAFEHEFEIVKNGFEHWGMKMYKKGEDYVLTGWLSMPAEDKQQLNVQQDIVYEGDVRCTDIGCKACFSQHCVRITEEPSSTSFERPLRLVYQKKTSALIACLGDSCYIKAFALDDRAQERWVPYSKERVNANYKSDARYSFRTGRKLPDYIHLPELAGLADYVYQPPAKSKFEFEKWLQATFTGKSIGLKQLITPVNVKKDVNYISYPPEGGYELKYDPEMESVGDLQDHPMLWYRELVQGRSENLRAVPGDADGISGILRNTHGESFAE